MNTLNLFENLFLSFTLELCEIDFIIDLEQLLINNYGDVEYFINDVWDDGIEVAYHYNDRIDIVYINRQTLTFEI